MRSPVPVVAGSNGSAGTPSPLVALPRKRPALEHPEHPPPAEAALSLACLCTSYLSLPPTRHPLEREVTVAAPGQCRPQFLVIGAVETQQRVHVL